MDNHKEFMKKLSEYGKAHGVETFLMAELASIRLSEKVVEYMKKYHPEDYEKYKKLED